MFLFLEALGERAIKLHRAMTAAAAGGLLLALGPATATMAPPTPGYLLYPRAAICIVPPADLSGTSPGGVMADTDGTVPRRLAVTPNPRRLRIKGTADGAVHSWLANDAVAESPRVENPPDGG
jgi:hypothetical protein